jgi:hypothetical protein
MTIEITTTVTTTIRTTTSATAKTTELRMPRRVPVARGGGAKRFLPVLLVLAVGCTSAVGEQTTAPDSGVATMSPTTTEATTTPPTESATTTEAVDPAVVVGESLSASGSNYRFSSVVLVGEETLTSITGVVDGTSVGAEITTGTGVVSYVRTPEGEWVTEADGTWSPLEGEAPVSAPLAILADSSDLTLETGDSVQSVFTGRLGPAAGPAQGVPFTLTIENGLVTEIRYQVESSGGPAQVITSLTEIGAAGSVSAPEGA